jgi:hypothetical protein
MTSPPQDDASARHRTNGGRSASDSRSSTQDSTLASALEDLYADAKEIASASRRIALIQWLELQLALRRGIVMVVVGAWVTLIVVVASIAAAIHLVRGVIEGVAAASGRSWIGELAGGALVLATLAGVACCGHAVWSRRNSRRTADRLGIRDRQGEA